MKRILLAYDGSDPSKRALEQVAELAIALKAEVSVVSVIPARPGPVPLDPWDDRAVHDQALGEARKLLTERGIEPHLLEPAGDPARTIEHVADEGNFDMVVIGSRGLGMLGRLMQGSVSEHVATHAHQSVIVVH
ncbi:MAG: universal stress protein [Candidatus Limnocylindrales bacterium]|jgi:nucleotide-binding universal stress UspA family protein